MDSVQPVLRVILFILLVLLDAVFSGAAVAIGHLNESKLTEDAQHGDKKASYILKLLEQPASLINTAHLVVNATAMISGAYVARLFYEAAASAGIQYFEEVHPLIIQVVIAILIILIFVIIVLVAGIIVPKKVAAKDGEKFLYRTIGAIRFFMALFRPLTSLITALSNQVARLFGVSPDDRNDSVTEEEIIMMVSEGHEQGVLEENEAEMINNIFEFNDKEVSDIMTHRKDMVAVNVDMSASDAAELMLSQSYSRYPVYEGDTENIVGILHLKDMMRVLSVRDSQDVTVRGVMRQPYFVPDTQKIDQLFTEMQAKKIHIAIVIDEYGQTAGLIAMEDILEEIVGNIFDEYDPDENYIQQVDAGVWTMQGSAPLDEVGEALSIEDLDEGEFETLNGLLVALLDHIPAEGEKDCVEYAGYRFEILEVENNMIQQVRVTKKESEEEPPGSDTKDEIDGKKNR